MPNITVNDKCRNRQCLGSKLCPKLLIDYSRQTELLRRISKVPEVRRVFINSSIRYDMIVADKVHRQEYLDRIVTENVSEQMKIASEHVSDDVLRLMGKPSRGTLEEFCKMFFESMTKCGSDEYLMYYFIAIHPGCIEDCMRKLSVYYRNILHIRPEQVQVFTPTQSSYSTIMYRTSEDIGGKRVRVERSVPKRQRQEDRHWR